MKAVVDAMRAGLPSNDAVREGSRSCTRARYGVLHFERKYLRTNMEILFNDDRCTLSKNWTRML